MDPEVCRLVVVGLENTASSRYTRATPMRLFVAATDSEWFDLHASKSQVYEVNFWRPSPEATFKVL
jgi:hypothetical protein